MARKNRLYLFIAVIIACAFGSEAQAPPPILDTNPRQFDARYVGARAMLGPRWLFSEDDNPAYSLPNYDDTSWKTVSTDKSLLSYGIRNIRYAWYRMHVQVRSHAHYLALEIQYIEGSCEI